MKVFKKAGRSAVALVSDEHHINIILPDVVMRLENGGYSGITYGVEGGFGFLRVPYEVVAHWKRKVAFEDTIADIERSMARILEENAKKKKGEGDKD